MGRMRFEVDDPNMLGNEALPRIYMSGYEEVPWPTHAVFQDGLLVVDREVSESGHLHVPWRVSDYGEWTLATASLMERQRPYRLEVELARGLLSQISYHLAIWEAAGLDVSDEISSRLAEAKCQFARIATRQIPPSEGAMRAHDVIHAACGIAVALGRAYCEQAVQARHHEAPRLPALLGIQLGRHVLSSSAACTLAETFHLAVVPTHWRQLETQEGQRDWTISDQQVRWCQQAALKICAGPLLALDSDAFPDWLILWDGDFENLLSLTLEHVHAVVSRYRGRVHLWQVASRINLDSPVSLNEQQKIELLVRAIDTTRRLDPQTPRLVSFDQPWGEYLARGDEPLMPPLYTADALLRAQVGIAGLGLEINVGYDPGGTLPRSLLELSDRLDQWSLLGMPLLVALCTPSSTDADHLAVSSGYRMGRPRPLAAGPQGSLSAADQNAWVAQYVPLLLAKSYVQVIVWNQLRDDSPHTWPHAGLFDTAGQAKPALETLRALRRKHLA